MMPLLIVLIIGVSVFCITRPGAMEGVKYYLLPDFSKFSATTVLAAMGQLFYSIDVYKRQYNTIVSSGGYQIHRHIEKCKNDVAGCRHYEE